MAEASLEPSTYDNTSNERVSEKVIYGFTGPLQKGKGKRFKRKQLHPLNSGSIDGRVVRVRKSNYSSVGLLSERGHAPMII